MLVAVKPSSWFQPMWESFSRCLMSPTISFGSRFGGKYMTDCRNEFPESWFEHAKLSHYCHDPAMNYFGVNASQSLSEWTDKGWIHKDDPRGWFQWYCRYYMGRRTPDDERQIKRWKAMKRHVAQVQKSCSQGDIFCRPKQRQALMNWAYDSRLL